MEHVSPRSAAAKARRHRGGANSAPIAEIWGQRRNETFFKSFAQLGFPYLAAAADIVSIMAAAFASAQIYRFITLGRLPTVDAVPEIGFIVALFTIVANIQRDGYSLKNYFSFTGHFAQCFPSWILAFFGVLALGFSLQISAIYSRGATAVLFLTGLVAMLAMRLLLVKLVRRAQTRGLLPTRRIFAIGFERELVAFINRDSSDSASVEISAAMALREPESSLREDLQLAAAAVRIYRPDDIMLAIPWRHADIIEACFDALLRTPAQIHVVSDEILERFTEARIAQIGDIAGLSLTRAPLSLLQRFEKRSFDLIGATIALVILAPVMASVAILLRFERKGPVLFMQKRYGFNQEPFRIAKFRTMTTTEDGRLVRSVERDDPRVTPLGAFLRRSSLDELPQLVNVLKGEMSLVGPRPHALAHDQSYDSRIAHYARRHNMKPGITGWAQVSGHRGEIIGDQAMRARLEHDLYYIDHWSLWLDLKIIAKTIYSAKSRANAY